MNIAFENIIPAPLQEKIGDSEIWGRVIDFSPNQNYAVLAPSGKGKSTFVHTLYGLRKDYSGQLFWNKKAFSSLDWHEVQKLRSEVFGIVFQDLRLFPKLTPWENIALYHEGKELDKNHISNMAERLGIQDLLEQKTSLLSYGQMQRVAILRTLSRSFQWLVLDEPFSHLDEDNVVKAMGLIKEIAVKNNAGMILMGLDEIPNEFKADFTYKL